MPSIKPYRLAELAAISGATLAGNADCVITSLAPLQTAQAGQLGFLDDPRYQHYLKTSQASAVLVSEQHKHDCAMNILIS